MNNLNLQLKRKINTLCLVVFIFFLSLITVNTVYGQSQKHFKNQINNLPFPFSSVVEYDSSASMFYGHLRKDGFSYFACIDSVTGKTTLLGKLPPIDGWVREASALDVDNQKFFFIGLLKGKYNIFVVDTQTGHIINSSALAHPVKGIEYDPSTKLLLGLSFFSGIERFVSVNPSTGEILTKVEIPSVESTHSGVLLDIDNHKFFFLGSWKRRDHLYVISTKTGSMNELKGQSTGVNEYIIQSFKKGVTTATIFTSGVQSCTAIAGYDKESDVGFIAHYAPSYKEIERSLFRIDREVKEKNNNRGLKNMKLFVVGGVRGDPNSVKNLVLVYTTLVEKFGINYDEIAKFNTGISYNIVIYEGEVKVF